MQLNKNKRVKLKSLVCSNKWFLSYIFPCAYETLVCIFLHLYIFLLERTLSFQAAHCGQLFCAKVVIFIVMYTCVTNNSWMMETRMFISIYLFPWVLSRLSLSHTNCQELMKGLGFKSSGDEWHLITTIHDGANGLILCVIETQVYDLIHPCHVCFWLAKSDLMAFLKMFYGGFFIIMLIFILMVKKYILQ
jgi:hypothetical protein